LRAGIDTGQLGLNITQNLFNGNRTVNGVRQAESNIFGARESLRDTEQNVLLNGATAYMNVLRDTAILDLRKNNIIVLEEQLRQTRDRFIVGEVTRTDVAQAESSLATARSDYFTAQANLQTSIATYRRGSSPRGRLRVFFRTRLAARSTLRLPNIPKFKRQCMPWTRRPCRSSSSRGNLLRPSISSGTFSKIITTRDFLGYGSSMGRSPLRSRCRFIKGARFMRAYAKPRKRSGRPGSRLISSAI
jgi:hypothetical protein